VDEPIAWLQQAIADRMAAERFAGSAEGWTRCHALAKCQQTVEKAIKAIVAALRDARILHIEIGYRHEVERFLKVLIRMPHAADNRAIQRHLQAFLNQDTRTGIRALDALAPRAPSAGERPRRNTEYPFQDAEGDWTIPAAEKTFSAEEVERSRQLAHRIVDNAGRIIAAIRRAPK
jgi:HEPN domain-containing protein